MKRPEILFDSNFIADRYFSIKSHRFRGMDIYKDKGKVFPLLAPIRQHLESLQDPRFSRPPSITPNISSRPKKAAIQPVFMSSYPKRVKRYKYKGLVKEVPIDEEQLALQQMYFLMQQEYPEEIEGEILEQVQQEGSENKDTDLSKKTSEEKPEIKPNEEDEEEILEEEEEPEESEDSPKKKRKHKKKKKEKKNEDDALAQLFNTEVPVVAVEEEVPRRRKLTVQEMVNKHKEAIQMLESPSDIYIRMAEMNITRNRNGSEQDQNEQQKKNKQKLERIMKKIDVKVQVGSQGSILDNKTTKTLTEMKRVPIEYFKRLRNDKSRSRGHNVSADFRLEDVQNSSQIFFNFDSQKNIEFPRDVTLAHINTTLAEEIFTENISQQKRRPSIISKVENSINKKVSAWELVKCEEDAFLSPLHNKYQSSVYNNSTVGSTRAMNAKTRNDSLNQSFLIRTQNHITSTIYKSGRSRSEIAAEKNRSWLSSRVSQLGFEIEDVLNQTTMDLGRLKECKKALAEDVRKIGTRKLDLRGEEEERDQHHYEDALKVLRQKLQREYPSSVNMNFGKGSLKNKKDRSVDNVKFEKNLAKVEKKIVERSKIKVSQINSKRPNSNKAKINSSMIESSLGDF